jgi:heme/copper-type cytochrome/quinol oxidase subunit 3
MPRRIYTYGPETGWAFWNLFSTVGSAVLGVSFLMLLVGAVKSLRSGQPAGNDPWDGRTLEWRISSPPPLENFTVLPPVYARDSFWLEKYGDRHGRRPAPAVPAVAHEHLHLPSPSHHPVVLALGLAIAAVGALSHIWIVIAGALVAVAALFLFALEHHANAAHIHQDGAIGIDHRKLGMWVFLGSECMFFGTLIAAYLAYKGRSTTGPAPHEILSIPITTVSTFDLLMSSLLMVLALAALQRGDHRQARLWLFGTAFFGLIFLGFQAYEFTSFVHEGLTLQTSLFGSTFFVLTGFHGGHVTIGVIWLLTLAILSVRGRLLTTDAVKVEIAGLYWHFVDIVWIAIFTLIYLIP